ncbi:MAG: pyridoxamine 5'-phosphate oxidase family protein [Burkholderiales bacterium]|jgi:hypothetical protein|nr:pyridoxamine 5'-phosphate oxidase family protein [Burkholderiales bacterium]
MAAIRDIAHLRRLIGDASPLVASKLHSALTPQGLAFLARCPFAVLSTTDARGQSMASPKGDAPGFIHAEDARTLLIPERPGNRLVFSLQNLLANPRASLLCFVPGTGETLRIEGCVQLVDDAALNARFAARGKPALLVMQFAIEVCYFHCAKSLLRAGLWQPDAWSEAMRVSFGQEIAARGGIAPDAVSGFDEAIAGRYRTDL